MSDPIRFLGALAQAFSVMTLYPAGHPSREGAVDDAYQELDALAASSTTLAFTFLEDQVIFDKESLRGLKAWEWGPRLIGAGIQRLEVQRRVSRDEFDSCLEEILARLTLAAVDTSESRQTRTLGIRFGAVGLQNESASQATETPSTTLELTLGEEAETLRWLLRQVQDNVRVPLVEAEVIVRSLSVAMHADRQVVLPLLQLREFDQYTTTHSLNVAVLAMGLAEQLKCTPREVRALGLAGLLHDIGKVHIPIEILTKPGRLTDEERSVMQAHPVAGARLIMESGERLDLAAVVAYEHHIMLDGHGYPGTPLWEGVRHGEPAGARLRRLRRPPDESTLSRRLVIGEDARLLGRARGHGIRSEPGHSVRQDAERGRNANPRASRRPSGRGNLRATCYSGISDTSTMCALLTSSVDVSVSR